MTIELDLEGPEARVPTTGEAEAPVMVAEDTVPPWAFFFEPDDFQSFKKIVAATAPAELSIADCAELARICRGHPTDRWALMVRTYFSVDDTLFGSAIPATIVESPFELSSIPDRTVVDAPLDPRGVAPLVYEPEWVPSPSSRQESSIELALPEPEPAREEPPLVRSRRRWVLGSLAGLAILGAAALAAGLPGEAGVAVHLDRVVTVEAGTANASIVGEDGTVLGPGPLAISVPDGMEVAVLVTARNHRPERIVLPAGGTLRVTLAPLPDAPETCALEVPSGVTVDGITSVLDGPQVRGAAVVRAKVGDRMRANIVECGRSTRIDAPSGAQVGLTVTGDEALLLDGNPVPNERTTVRAGFHRITSKGRERWVPVFRTLELRP